METQHETATVTHHSGVSAPDHARIIRRIAKDHGMTEAHAADVFEETLRFLSMAASYPTERFAPSKEVDKGWHTFLLYTKAYRAYCQSLGRRFIDHEPDDLETAPPTKLEHCGINCQTGCDSIAVERPKRKNADTVGFMEAHGIAFNRDLWPVAPKTEDCVPDPCTCTGDDTELRASPRCGAVCDSDVDIRSASAECRTDDDGTCTSAHCDAGSCHPVDDSILPS